METKTRYEVRNQCLIVYLYGELDQHLVDQLRGQMDRYLMMGNMENVIFDFSLVDFMDSSGIGMIMGRYKQARRWGGKVYVVCANANIQRILKISGLTKLVVVKEELEDVLDGMGEGGAL